MRTTGTSGGGSPTIPPTVTRTAAAMAAFDGGNPTPTCPPTCWGGRRGWCGRPRRAR